jgi:hypothetical protein
MRVRDLENWPPQPSGAYKGAYSIHSSEEVIIKRVVHMRNNWIVFSCEFDGERLLYDFEARDERTLPILKSILEKNSGKSLFSIGEIEIPEED